MKVIKLPKIQSAIILTLLLLMSHLALAQPTYQIWTPDWTYVGDYAPPDQDTWYIDSSSFELWAIGAYHNEISLTENVLLLSVPNGETGTISISYLGSSSELTLIGSYTDTSFFPANFNNHYPLQDPVSDFLIYDLGDFINDPDTVIYDYNADGGTITPTGATGEIKKLSIEVSGYTSVHFDMYGLVTTQQGPSFQSTWDQDYEISPGSHDVTYIPAPGAILLGGIGVCLVGWLRRRRTL